MESPEKKRITSSVLPELNQTKYHLELNKPSKVIYMPDQIPEHICIHIFSFLYIEDLIRVCGVCKFWRDLIHTTPSVWRTMHLRLSSRQPCLEPDVVCRYAIQFGAHCRKLTICYDHCLFVTWVRNLLLNLRPTSLTSLMITGVRRSISNVPEKTCIVEALTRMLSRSQHLQNFGMPFAFWEVGDGIKVLEPVLSMYQGTLESLMIEGFFDYTFYLRRPVKFDQLTTGILLLNNLTELGIDYCVLTDAFVNALSCSNAKLKKLKLFENKPFISARISILRSSWVNLNERCPEMKVAFLMHCKDRLSLEFILGMLDPVLKVNDLRVLYTDAAARLGWSDVADALNDIRTWYRESLVTLVLDVNNTDTIDGAFLRLVRQCEHLVYVNVSANFEKPGTEKTAMKLIQKRMRKLNMKKMPENFSKCLRKNPAEGPSSNTADTRGT